ncbi:hypothetical protein PMAYCL1PPCAC_03103, partial [Pristionchus mayeri]
TTYDQLNVCRTSSLIFALLTAHNQASDAASLIDLQSCQDCASLPVSREFLRLCPNIDRSIPLRSTTSTPSSTTTTTTTSAPTTTLPAMLNVSVPLSPIVLDATSDETATITLNLSSVDVSSATVRKCWLTNKDGSFDASSVTLNRETSTLSLSIHQSLFHGEVQVACNLTSAGKEMLVIGSSAVVFLPFFELVRTADDFISSIPVNVERKYLQISFSRNPLDARLAGTPYCFTVEGTRFNATGSLDSINCDISSLSSAGNYSIYGVRSEKLENVTRKHQTPTVVLMTDVRVTTTTARPTTTSTTAATSAATTPTTTTTATTTTAGTTTTASTMKTTVTTRVPSTTTSTTTVRSTTTKVRPTTSTTTS